MFLDLHFISKNSNKRNNTSKESISRSALKAISWRLVGTLDTIVIAYFITGTITQALSIGFIEWGTKNCTLFFSRTPMEQTPMEKKSSQMKNLSIEKLNEIFKNYTLKESFDHLMELGFKNMSFSTSFGQEDQVITDVIFNNDYPISVFTLDTGRLFEATHRVFDDTQNKYRKTINAYFPDREAVEKLLTEKGAYSFYKSVDNRKECCQIRKVNPLQRALKGVDLWITGLRANQSTARNKIQMFGYDNAFGLPKFNPLAHWDLSTVEKYLEQNQVPQNHLHKEGFVSIGCAPCTRAVKEGEDIRSGRWWWEDSKKECGLHLNTKS